MSSEMVKLAEKIYTFGTKDYTDVSTQQNILLS